MEKQILTTLCLILLMIDIRFVNIGWFDSGIQGHHWMLSISASNTEKLQPDCGVHIFKKWITF